MTKDEIKDLWDLARYINEQYPNEFDVDGLEEDIEEVCEKNGWEYYDSHSYNIASHNGWHAVFLDDGTAGVVKPRKGKLTIELNKIKRRMGAL